MKKYDLIVVGGGFSGTAAAIAAARNGQKVMLIEKANSLGGAAANCLVNPFMPNSTKIDKDGEKEFFYLSQGLFSEILENLRNMNAATGERTQTFNEEYLKLILNRMVLAENIDILFRSVLIDVNIKNNKIDSLVVANKSGKTEYFANYFIDATGDADLAAHSGCDFQLGREKDGLCQPMTLSFRLANVDMEKYRATKPKISELYNEFQKQGKIKNPRENVLVFNTLIDGVLHFNSTRIVKLNPTSADDLTKAEIESREQVFELYSFLKENFEAFKNAKLLMTASEIGVRESRNIKGEYILTGKDIISCTKFEDSIALGNYDVDIHNPEGSGTSHHYFKDGEYYTIPYRSLIPKVFSNLLVSGRCISADHEAQASIRIMPIVCCIGEAAGTAISIANESGLDVREVSVDELQKRLKKQKAVF